VAGSVPPVLVRAHRCSRTLPGPHGTGLSDDSCNANEAGNANQTIDTYEEEDKEEKSTNTMESTLNNPTLIAARPKAKSGAVAYWSVTGLLCLWMAATAWAQLTVPQVAEAYRQLGFPSASFRVELSWAKFLGIAALLLPAPARIKEWAYAGFAIDFVSAFTAHVSAGQGPEHWIWAVVAFALLAVSWVLRERLQPAPTEPENPEPHKGELR
jgi:hypothetical protein